MHFSHPAFSPFSQISADCKLRTDFFSFSQSRLILQLNKLAKVNVKKTLYRTHSLTHSFSHSWAAVIPVTANHLLHHSLSKAQIWRFLRGDPRR